jgi:hypothetical protein
MEVRVNQTRSEILSFGTYYSGFLANLNTADIPDQGNPFALDSDVSRVNFPSMDVYQISVFDYQIRW